MGNCGRHEKVSKSWEENLRVGVGSSQYRGFFFSVYRHFSYFSEAWKLDPISYSCLHKVYIAIL